MTRYPLAALTLALAATSLFAQVPGDNAPPPPQGQHQPGMPGMQGMPPAMPPGMMPPGMMGGPGQPGETTPVTYLGVEASPIDSALQAQVRLAKGDGGLVVNYVDPESPAAKAGLQRFDILTKLGDQILVNPPQLQTLIQTKDKGTQVTLTFIRTGETKTISVTLGEKKMEAWMPSGMHPTGPGGMPMMMPPGGGMGHMGGSGMGGMGGMRGMGMPGRGFDRGMDHRDGGFIGLSDKRMDLMLSSEAGHLMLRATDREDKGKAEFYGPVDTPAQRDALPAEVKKPLDTLVWEHLRNSLGNADESPRIPDPHAAPTPVPVK